jgi:threonine synthase
MPEVIPLFSEAELSSLSEKPFYELAFEIARRFVGSELDHERLLKLVKQSYNFDLPLIELDDHTRIMELFHGPTLAFKDFGARFMARLIGAFAEEENRQITILVATSGDTGSAVAYGFQGVPNTRVVILYPSGKVSDIQEKQLTTLGDNVHTLEIKGDFDACQALVKEAFGDPELRAHLSLTSANSINISRLIPQSFYYAYAALRLQKIHQGSELLISVPSGNFGNLTAGVFAQKMGFPISHFIAATNLNDSVPRYLKDGCYDPRATIETLSTAMDVGNPSNFARLLDIYKNDLQSFREAITAFVADDAQTRQTMKEIFQQTGYVLDPHTAVGVKALQDYRAEFSAKNTHGVVLSTAHPAKFYDVVLDTLHKEVEIPDRLKKVLDLEKKARLMENDFKALKSFLLSFPC